MLSMIRLTCEDNILFRRLEKLGPRNKHSYTIWLTAWVSFRVAYAIISVHCSWLVAVPSGHSITNCNLTYTFENTAGRLCTSNYSP